MITRFHKREQSEGRVAQPAVAIVPIAHASDCFRERSGGSRDDAAGGRVGKTFERDERAHHRVVPFVVTMTALRPFAPKLFRVAQRMLRMDFSRWLLVRRKPGEYERNTIALCDREFPNRCQIFAARLDRRSQDQSVRSRDRFKSAMPLPHPRNDLSVIEADNQLHVHPHRSAHPFDDADDVRVLAPRRHEIDQTHRTAFGFNFRLEDKRVAAIPPARPVNLFFGKK